MMRQARNTLASIEESSTKVAEAFADAGPTLEEMAREVHRTCVDVQRAAQAHRRAASVAETLVWGVVLGLAAWVVVDTTRGLWSGLRHG